MLLDLDYFRQTNEKKCKNAKKYILNQIVIERIRKGVPDCLRIKVWPKMAEIEKFKISENIHFNVPIDFSLDLKYFKGNNKEVVNL